MKNIQRFIIFGFTLGLIISCADDSKNTTIETEEIQFTKEGELVLLKINDTVTKLDIEFAETPYEKQTGLMYRKSMKPNQGMLFTYTEESIHSFYMKNTYIPLDLIFFGKDSLVVSFQENAKPLDETSLSSKVPAQFILEVNAGKVKQWNLTEGDKMIITKD